jgi:hypothetical protein
MSVCVCLCDVAFLSACSLPSERFETFLPSRRRNCFVILNKFIDGMPSRGAECSILKRAKNETQTELVKFARLSKGERNVFN